MSIRKKYLPRFMIIPVFTLSACGSKTFETPLVTPPAISVTISDEEDCPSVEVQPGMQVAWTNASETTRIVQADALPDGSRKFDAGELQPGDSFIFTFMEAGSYAYPCSSDGAMKGTVTVTP
jgi:plastocyanin